MEGLRLTRAAFTSRYLYAGELTLSRFYSLYVRAISPTRNVAGTLSGEFTLQIDRAFMCEP